MNVRSTTVLVRVMTGLVIALSFVVPNLYTAYAVEDRSESILLTPTSKRYTVDAGEVVNDSFTIINNGKNAYEFTVVATPYSVRNEAYSPEFQQETVNSDAYKWIQFTKVKWSAAPGETVEIPYTMRVSEGAKAGGHYGAIFAQTVANESDGATGIVSSKSVGLILYANVNGPTKEEGRLQKVDIPFYQTAAPLDISAYVENSGEVDFETKVTFAVMDLAGDVKYQTSAEYPVLPGTTRRIDLEWNQAAWFGIYKTRVEATILGVQDVKEGYIVLAPRWLLFVGSLALLLGVINVVRSKTSHTRTRRS
ncbi:hypothetical protein EOL96_04190 [Candidatus Saccharibacteria bacterium]|nr:hypothetical protein [Candidatus Saccharibacteria bacterium]